MGRAVRPWRPVAPVGILVGVSDRPWRAVVLPTEHGGWGLTLEPVLLGLLLAPSWAGAAIGAAAFLAFLARTPAKLVAVDRRRGRWLDRTTRAAVVVGAELAVIGALAVFATVQSDRVWWVPVLVALPLVAVEWWFDIRSRGRRLVPEVAGAIGVAASVAAIVLADDSAAGRLAAGAWIVLAARSLGAIPFVRAQIARARHGIVSTGQSDAFQVLSVVVASAAVVLDVSFVAGALGVLVLAALQARWSRHDPPAIKVVGVRQMVLGIALVLVTAAGTGLG
jgi:hypothetical protein